MDLGKESNFWKFIGGNYSVYIGVIKNVKLAPIRDNLHYKFDFEVCSEGKHKRVINDIISCPYMQLDEKEHRLILEETSVTMVGKFVPVINNFGNKYILTKRIVAVKFEETPKLYFTLSKTTF